MCGADITESKLDLAGGVHLPLFPMIVFAPAFATCLTVRHLLYSNCERE
jgi:hypothetical protein